MRRRSLRTSSGTTAAVMPKSSPGTPVAASSARDTSVQKRGRPSIGKAAMTRATPVKTPPRRGSAKKATPVKVVKSRHFTSTVKDQLDGTLDEDDVEEDPEADDSPSTPSDDVEASGYEDEDASEEGLSSAADEEEEDESFDDDEAERPRKRRRLAVAKNSKARVSATARAAPVTTTPVAGGGKGRELWREGVTTGLGHGTQVVIKKPQARGPGGTPYRDDALHPNTLLFLEELRVNNEREWLKMHDANYRAAWRDFETFLGAVQARLVAADPTIPEELPPKDVFFRIYRDVRFSKDQTPYKDHFSAAWSRTGRKGPYAVYYLQIKPGGGSFVGGGYWHPEAGTVARLRRDIDRRPARIRAALLDEGLRRHFMGGAPASAPKVVRAFAASNAESALKTRPKDYPGDHRDIELLRLRNFTLGRKIGDDELTLDRIAELLAALYPLITYLNAVVMPDEPDEDDDEDDDDDDDDEEDVGGDADGQDDNGEADEAASDSELSEPDAD